jgi:hypothetical protein
MYAKRGRDCAISVDVRLGGSRGAGLVSMDSLHNQDLQSEVHECLGSGRTKLVDLYLSGRDHDLQHLEFKVQRLLSSPVEEERSSSAGRRRLSRKGMGSSRIRTFRTCGFQTKK